MSAESQIRKFQNSECNGKGRIKDLETTKEALNEKINQLNDTLKKQEVKFYHQKKENIQKVDLYEKELKKLRSEQEEHRAIMEAL